jgi:hypothetical protein
MAPRNIRITNDQGHSAYTRIVDTETGEDLTRKLMVTHIEMDVSDMVQATLHVIGPHINVVARAETKRTATVTFDPDDPGSVERALMAVRAIAAGEEALHE